MAPANKWRVVLLFFFCTLVVASLNRRVSELLPSLEALSSILAICLAAGLTAAFIARRGEFIPPGSAALAVSVPLSLIGLALILVAGNNPDTPLHVWGLSYGAAILVYGIPSYWLLTKLPTSGWLPTKAKELSVPPAELTRGFVLFPMVLLAVCGLIVLVLSGVLFWVNGT
jgi:hypothetical protein